MPITRECFASAPEMSTHPECLETWVTPTVIPESHQRRCIRCHKDQRGVSPQWFQHRGGSIHLGWICCGKPVQGPIPHEDVQYYPDVEPIEVAEARFAVAKDTSWPLLDLSEPHGPEHY
jgi:hypothetical protein